MKIFESKKVFFFKLPIDFLLKDRVFLTILKLIKNLNCSDCKLLKSFKTKLLLKMQNFFFHYKQKKNCK